MGGISSEHDVSMHSGAGILKQLNRKKFNPFPLIISKSNQWIWPKNREDYVSGHEELVAVCQDPDSKWNCVSFPLFDTFPKADVFFIGLHGEGGEDGKLQSFLELAGQKYTGSKPMGSALAMDKCKSKEIFTAHGIPTAPYEIRLPSQYPFNLTEIIEKLGLPLVAKVSNGGSSLGVEICQDLESVENFCKSWVDKAPAILFEKYIKGPEATCGYLKNYKALIPTEIVPQQDNFFNYEAKYQENRSLEITPARFPEEVLEQLQMLAEKCHQALSLDIYSRSDFIMSENGPLVLEVNNLPGFTPNSLLPKCALGAGLEYPNLLEHIIFESLKS